MGEEKRIKVGVDILDLCFAKTGQKTFLEELYHEFLQNKDEQIQFVFLDAQLPSFSRSSKLGIIMNHFIYQWYKQVLLPFKAWSKGVDILFCCDYYAPIITPGFKNVQVYHDAFFYEYPAHYNPLWLKFFRFFAIPAAKNSAYIITPTEYSKTTIHKHIGLPFNKIKVVNEGPKNFSYAEHGSNICKWTPPSVPYLLHVGVWEKRKNIPNLLKAFKQLIDELEQPLQLVLVGTGNQKKYSDDTEQINECIEALQLGERVICTGYLPDADVAKAYQHATLYIFPSYNEGFGIPILEAFSFNIPVLVANNSCLPEVGGDAVIQFDPFSVADIQQKIKEVLNNNRLQEDLKEKGRQQLSKYSWSKAKKEIIQIFKEAATNGK
jgi:glycosyltransferase involved in cell wall biosynthesis